MKLLACSLVIFSHLVVGAACGGNSARVSPELYARLSHDDQAAIYERENDVTIAWSRRDDAVLAVRNTRLRLDELSEQWRHAKERFERTNQSARVDGAAKLRDTHKAFLEEQLRIAEAHVSYREKEIVAARARLDRQRARQLVKSGMASEKTLDDFEKRVKDSEQEARDSEKRELDLRSESQKKFLEWKAAENEYARASGDYDSLVWVD